MSANRWVRPPRSWARWLGVLLFAGLSFGLLPNALAQAGSSASEAISVGPDGGFTGSIPAGSSLWYTFNYIGANQPTTATITYLPPDANQMDMQLYSGDPKNPAQVNTLSQQTGNTRAIVFKDASATQVFVRVINNNNNRTVTFNGTLSPTSTVALPTPTAVPTGTPTGGPTATPGSTSSAMTVTPMATATGTAGTSSSGPATNATPGLGETSLTAAVVGGDGGLSGTIATRRAVWYRFWYGNPGANATVAVTISPNADASDLNLYTGTDPNNLTQQPGTTGKAQNTLTRDINLPNMQYVYFAVANNTNSTILSYTGSVTPAFAPMTVTPVIGGGASETGSATPFVTPTSSPTTSTTTTATASVSATSSTTPTVGATATPTSSGQ